MSEQQCITLVVTNTQVLEAGLSATKTFYAEGGSIGASPGDDWNLRDRKGKVRLSHCKISVIDGEFCITDTSDATYVNGASMPIGWGKHAQLNENDTVAIGPYEIRVHFAEEEEVFSGKTRSLKQVFSDSENSSLLAHGAAPVAFDAAVNDDSGAVDDPLAALDELEGMLGSDLDDLSLDTSKGEDESDFLTAKDQQWQGSSMTVQADSDYETSSAISLQQASTGDHGMGEDTLESLELTAAEQRYAPDAGSSHFVAGPMIRGLGVSIGKSENLADMQMLAEELGCSLQAAVKGLLSLHQQVEDSRYGIMNKNLQPIEDNPLRLGLPYDETIKTMYDGKRSLVHLAAPAAIEESLSTVKNHNEAVQTATAEALTQVLRAFSPDVLMKRFKSYRRTELHESESQEAWAWEMYNSYYAELISERQKGFEKLFWEIFDQAYDKKLREMQRES